MNHRRLAVSLGTVLVLSAAWTSGTTAQGADIADSLCKALSRKEVRQALGTKTHVPSPEADLLYCAWRPEAFDEPEITLNVHWSDWTLDQMRQLSTDADGAPIDLVVAGRPALFQERSGLSELFIDVDPGVLLLSLDDRVERDGQPILVGLGERAVARAASLVRPSSDPTLIARFPTAVGDATVLTRPEYVRRAFQDRDRRRAFRAAVEAAGKTLADVSLASATVQGPTGEVGPRIDALRIAGTDAAEFVDFAVHQSFEVLPDPLANGEVGYLADAGGDPRVVTYVYPKEDVVWTVYGAQAQADEVLALLPGGPSPVPIPTPAPTPTPVPTPTPDLSTVQGRIQAMLPGSVGGEALESLIVFTGKDVETYLTPDAAKAFRRALKDQGKAIRDLSIIQGRYGMTVGLQGTRIEGGDAAPFAAFNLDQIRAAGLLGQDEQPVTAEVGGKQVGTVPYGENTVILYTSGDTAWVVTVVDERAGAELLAALP